VSLASLGGLQLAGVDAVDAQELMTALVEADLRFSNRLVRIDTEPLDAGLGSFSRLIRLKLLYRTRPSGAPRSLILKLPSNVEANHARAVSFDLYRREALFYRDVAPTLVVRVPRCHWSSIDTEGNRATLLLEDLSGMSRGDQLAGMNAARALCAVRCAARMHAQWWETPTLAELSWLPCLGGWTKGELVRAYGAHWPAFTRVYHEDLPHEVVRTGHRLCSELEALLHEIAASARTLVHGDYRADNLFFDGVSSAAPLAVIDWQLCCRGSGAFDIAYLLTQSMEVASRRRFEMRLLREWHRTLVASGVSAYSFDDAVRDYRRGVTLCLAYVVVGAGLDRVGSRAQALARAQVTRTIAAMHDQLPS
jgi:hypothetical protein